MHVSCNFEKEIDGTSQPMGTIIREANRKNTNEIHDEIHNYADEGYKKQIGPLKNFARLPRFLRAIFISPMLNNPNKIAKQGFNRIITSMGMFGAGGGHVIPYQHCSLCISIAGFTRKLALLTIKLSPANFSLLLLLLTMILPMAPQPHVLHSF
jgi:hypothetical protein